MYLCLEGRLEAASRVLRLIHKWKAEKEKRRQSGRKTYHQVGSNGGKAYQQLLMSSALHLKQLGQHGKTGGKTHNPQLLMNHVHLGKNGKHGHTGEILDHFVRDEEREDSDDDDVDIEDEEEDEDRE